MCLSIPGKVIEIKEDKAIVDYGKEQTTANNSLVNAKVDDYVIVSTKFVIEIIPKEEALKTLELWKNDS